jgi:hypothetical protein
MKAHNTLPSPIGNTMKELGISSTSVSTPHDNQEALQHHNPENKEKIVIATRLYFVTIYACEEVSCCVIVSQKLSAQTRWSWVVLRPCTASYTGIDFPSTFTSILVDAFLLKVDFW